MDTYIAESWSEEFLEAASERARSTLVDTGFGRFTDQLGSDEAWRAFNGAMTTADGPMSASIRAQRARTCLLLIDLIRAANNDSDGDAVIRYSVSLGALDNDLLGYAEQTKVMAPRYRTRGVRSAAKQRRDARDARWASWADEEIRYRARHPNASHTAIATHIAGLLGANPETVRKALRILRREAAAPKKQK